MRRNDIRTDQDMLAYILDCTLGTVERYSLLSRPPKSEVTRQCSLADTINEWLGPRPIEIDSRRYDLLQHPSALAYYQSLRGAS